MSVTFEQSIIPDVETEQPSAYLERVNTLLTIQGLDFEVPNEYADEIAEAWQEKREALLSVSNDESLIDRAKQNYDYELLSWGRDQLAQYFDASLTGLAAGPEDIKIARRFMDALLNARGYCSSNRVEDAAAFLQEMEATVMQRFIERIDDADTPVVHYSSSGIDILRSRQLLPSVTTKRISTSGHSTRLHFTKQIDPDEHKGYMDYSAYVNRVPFVNEQLDDAAGLGIAVVVPQDRILEQYPIRAETAHNGVSRHGATDVVFAGEQQEQAIVTLDDPAVKFAVFKLPSSEKLHQFVRHRYDTEGLVPNKYEVDVYYLTEVLGLDPDWVDAHYLSLDVSDIPTRMNWSKDQLAQTNKPHERRPTPEHQAELEQQFGERDAEWLISQKTKEHDAFNAKRRVLTMLGNQAVKPRGKLVVPLRQAPVISAIGGRESMDRLAGVDERDHSELTILVEPHRII